MKRREFITLLGGTAVAWPRVARAQQPAKPVIGFLSGASPDSYAPIVAAFRQGLKEVGYVEGQNVAIEYRWADGHYDRLPDVVADLIRRRVSVIAALGTPASIAAKTATSTTPIVFTVGSDPVQLGLVESMNRPGGNVTGMTVLTTELAAKRVEVAHELVPTATLIGLLVNPGNPITEDMIRASQVGAATLGLQLDVLQASTEAEIDAAFAIFVQRRAGVLVISADSFFNSHLERLATLAIRHRVPAIYDTRVFATSGGLMSNGGDYLDSYCLAGVDTGKILKGDKPADLPVQQSTKVELIINLKHSASRCRSRC